MIMFLLILFGIIVWPEMTLCVLLFWYGQPILGIIAVFTTFFSGSRLATSKLRQKFWGAVSKDTDEVQ